MSKSWNNSEKNERILRCRGLYRNTFVPVGCAISVG